MEYFHKLDSYALYESDFPAGGLPDPWPGRFGPANLMSYSYQAKALTNFALGFKQYISPSLNLMGGFRTDFTNGDEDKIHFSQNKFKINQIHLNKYHITLGPVLKLRNIRVVSGIQYSFGRNEGALPVVNYSDPIEFDPVTQQSLQGSRQKNSNYHISEISLFLGLSFGSD